MAGRDALDKADDIVIRANLTHLGDRTKHPVQALPWALFGG